MNVLERLRTAFAVATPAGGDAATFAAAVRPSTDSKFGDYQANGCMALAKRLGGNPRDLAKAVAGVVDLAPMADPPEIAGPGFLNVRLNDAWISSALGGLLADRKLGIEPPRQVRTVVIDYSSPNVAKPMHVGHIRSTVIGDSLARVFEALGARVVRDNHLGDWGTQFGMIIWGWKTDRNAAAFERDPVKELTRLYRKVAGPITAAESMEKAIAEAKAAAKQGLIEKKQPWNEADLAQAHAKLLSERSIDVAQAQKVIEEGKMVSELARVETAKLHSGDEENRALWQRFMPHCLAALHAIYDRLGVRFDHELGESFYDPMLADVVADLAAKGITQVSEGATAIFTEVVKTPFIVRKTDGAYNYATTDLATIKYRVDTWNPQLMLYVVDHRQSDHFKQLFEVARRWGYDSVELSHIAFGTILDQKRRPYKTREGDAVGLESLLDEAVSEARKVVDENSPDLDTEERGRVAEIVGLGAIKYADLSQNRLSDYIFDWQKMMAMNGNTGAYLQYAYARTQAVFRKGEITPASIRSKAPAILVSHPAERAIAVDLLRLPETLELTAAELKPNVLADYLYGLANKFSTFYTECPVLKAESAERRDSRLALCDLTGRTLAFGLDLLGMKTADRM
jgi:arginyl-tRNA synthetase